jgi:hypothetical protein
MAIALTPYPRFRAFTSNGDPLVGGKLYTYQTNTTTPKATYTDQAGLTPNSNPVILDADGEANVWLNGLYRFRLDDAGDITQWTIDNIGEAPILPDFPILSRDYSNDLAVAIAAIGTTPTKLAITAPTTISSTLTIPRNVQLWMWPAGLMTINNGQTLTLLCSIDAGETRIFAGAGILVYRSPTPMNVIWFGAIPDDTTDSLPAFTAAIAAAQTDLATQYGAGLAVLEIPPGRYHLSGTWLINREIRITGYSAVIDRTVHVTAVPCQISGLTVNNAPGVGFFFERAQVSTFSDLLAANCGSHGFQLGGSSATDAATRGLFIRCSALECAGYGLYMRENPGISVNANVFIQFDARNCLVGLWVDGGGVGVAGNTFIGTLSEGNTDNTAVFTAGTRDWVMLGGYFVGPDGTSIIDDSVGQGMILGAHIRGKPTGTAKRLFDTYFETLANDVVFERKGKTQQTRDAITMSGLDSLTGTGPFVATFGLDGDFLWQGAGEFDVWELHCRIASVGAPAEAIRSFFLNVDILVSVDTLGVWQLYSDEVSSARCTLSSVVLADSGALKVVNVTFSTTSSQTGAGRNNSYLVRVN